MKNERPAVFPLWGEVVGQETQPGKEVGRQMGSVPCSGGGAASVPQLLVASYRWRAAGHAGLPRGPGDPEAAESETSVLGKYLSLSTKPTPFSHC